MALTSTLKTIRSGDGHPTITKTITNTGDFAFGVVMTLANNTAQPMVMAFSAEGLKEITMSSSIAATVLFKDAGDATVLTVTLTADVPYSWNSQSGITNPFGTDVTHITVSSGAAGTLDIAGIGDNSPAQATAVMAGNFTTALESQIVSGGRVATLTLTGANWLSGAAFNAQRRAIIDGMDSAQAEAAGWDAQKANLADAVVVRTSATVVTVTLTALGSYSVTANEVITATIPAAAITAAEPIVATGTATITANS